MLPNSKIKHNSQVTVVMDDLLMDIVFVDLKEADERNGRYSLESPMAKALLGRRPGEEVEVKGHDGSTIEVTIVLVESLPLSKCKISDPIRI